MKMHIYTRLEDLETINNVISLKKSIEDVDKNITIFLTSVDIPKLAHVTIGYNEFVMLLDSEKIDIK